MSAARRTRLVAFAAFGSVAAIAYAACITPERGDYSNESTAMASPACLKCMATPDVPGPGCGDEFAKCRQARTCARDLECSLAKGCFGSTVQQLLGCSTDFCSFAFEGPDDPGRAAALAAVTCLTRGACASICFTDVGDASVPTGDVADTGTSDAGDAPLGTACVNDADRASLGDAAAVQAAEQTCGLRCFGGSDPECNAKCMGMTLGLSNECAKCWGAQIDCVAKNCLTQCIAGADAPECQTCTAQLCSPALHACSGL
jgi:hypothetical protein